MVPFPFFWNSKSAHSLYNSGNCWIRISKSRVWLLQNTIKSPCHSIVVLQHIKVCCTSTKASGTLSKGYLVFPDWQLKKIIFIAIFENFTTYMRSIVLGLLENIHHFLWFEVWMWIHQCSCYVIFSQWQPWVCWLRRNWFVTEWKRALLPTHSLFHHQ